MSDTPTVLRRYLEQLYQLPAEERAKKINTALTPWLPLLASVVIAVQAPRALATLTHRARDAGFDVPRLTRKQARGLWRPAAMLLAMATYRAAAGARIGHRDG